MKKSFVVSAGAVSLALALTGCGAKAAGTGSASAKTGTSSSAPSASATSSSQDKRASFKDGVLTTPDLRIEITTHKIIPVGKKGNEYGSKPVLAFWYKITNVSGQKTDPMAFITNISAYQDNNPNAENQLNVGSLPDDKFLDTQMESIKKGGTVESAIAYELDDLKTPVELVASNDLGMSEIGRVSYPLK
ncbi:hypothetical protein GCM10027517_28850 [Phycicoccus ginsengisoli]